MIDSQEYALLISDEVTRAVAQHRRCDHLEVALDSGVPHARVVATQVKYLARAAVKLPSYAAAQCILPPLAFEQASSERCAARKTIGGDRVLDLTCGLGVDAFALSRRFRRVVTLERNEWLARIAQENFRRLGVANVEVVCAAAEDYLQHADGRFDWVYADPDRRSAAGRKLVRLEECSPAIPDLLSAIRRVSGRLCLKNSPLFDVDEALRLFPAARVEVVSLDGECKEVVVYDDGAGPSVTATALGDPDRSFTLRSGGVPPLPRAFRQEEYRWLTVPDVALAKARVARAHLAGQVDIWSDGGFGFSVGRPSDAIGRVFAIESIGPYDPRQLKRLYKGCGATIFKRDFPLSADEIMRRTGLHAGGDLRLAFTRIDGRFWTIRLK